MRGLRILVLGASGYIGQHLIPQLCAQGHHVRAAARRIRWLQERNWPGVECQYVDLYQPQSLSTALDGIDLVYYLVHAMRDGDDFVRAELQAAQNVSRALSISRVQQVIFLGALQPPDDPSRHLAARRETGEILRTSGVPVTEVRSGIVIGPGSAAFEVMRDMVYNLAILTPPLWVRSKSAPIALENLLTYLCALASLPDSDNRVFEVAGPEYISYQTMFERFIRVSGKRRWMIPLPIPTRLISVYFLHLITSVPTSIARALIEGLKHDLPADDAAITQLIPQTLIGFDRALSDTLAREREVVDCADWGYDTQALARWRPGYGFYPKQAGCQIETSASRRALWHVVQQIGGDNGYFFANPLWQIRARLDDLTGNRITYGRPARQTLQIGDLIDGWRVIALRPGHQLTLLFGMKAPGLGRLSFTLDEHNGLRTLDVRAWWHPAGFSGLLYWFAMMPAHLFIFRGMARRIVELAEAWDDAQPTPGSDSRSATLDGTPGASEVARGRATPPVSKSSG
ncbi:SDR family oxidoreductase [Edwardsiella ictaluri]|uniref:SDR family oxidoreductase n=1 Tax=Edwardsiella ictaluri TaxID=67780 RepID=UPI00222848AE|nr:SDR family oxidoreductase [Edwardsiella ictaluri]UCQ49961.1 SDR family oxidoreductase [Edwardsiella ictaluri]WFO09441.1 SDR family oxidoreductase [Edwardsiella ictaluri]